MSHIIINIGDSLVSNVRTDLHGELVGEEAVVQRSHRNREEPEVNQPAGHQRLLVGATLAPWWL